MSEQVKDENLRERINTLFSQKPKEPLLSDFLNKNPDMGPMTEQGKYRATKEHNKSISSYKKSVKMWQDKMDELITLYNLERSSIYKY